MQRSQHIKVGSIIGASAALALAGHSHAGFAYDPFSSQVSVTFNVAEVPAASTFANAIGGGWYAPAWDVLGGSYEPTIGTHAGGPVTPNWVTYGTSATHSFLSHLAANGIVNAIPKFNITPFSHLLTADPGNAIPPAELRIEFNFEVVATPGGFNVGQLPAWMLLTYNVPAGSFGDFYAEINYAAVNNLGVVVPLGQQVLDATPGAAVLAGAGAQMILAPGAGLNMGFVAFNPNPMLNGHLRVSGHVSWIADNEGGPVTMQIEEGGTDEDAAINDDMESALLLNLNEAQEFDTSSATTDGPEGDSASCTPGKDIWYVVRTPGDGKMTISLCEGTSFDTTMSFYYLGNGSSLPDIDPDAIAAQGSFGCVDDTCGPVAGPSVAQILDVTTDDWILVRVGGYDLGDRNDPASGAGSIIAKFAHSAYSTGNTNPVYFENPANGACDTQTYLGLSCGDISPTQHQRWSAQGLTIPAGPQFGGYAISEIHGYGFTPANVTNEALNYIVWHRNGLIAPVDGDQLFSGAVPFPTPIDVVGGFDSEDHVIDLSTSPIELAPGDYWLTLYASNSSGGSVPANFAWFTNSPDGINVLDGNGNPFSWRSSNFPSPGFLPSVIAAPSCFAQTPGNDPKDLYNCGFAMYGTPLVGTPPCPADLNGDSKVDAADLAALLGNWGSSGLGDLNGDGNVNGADLAALLGSWGNC